MPILESSSLDIGQEVLVPRSKKRKVVKTPDDKIPLPDPYPLPKHFKSDVEADLKSCNMSTTTYRLFISDVASSMLAYKQYPTEEDRTTVARAIFNKYPFLKPVGCGTPYVSFKYIVCAC